MATKKPVVYDPITGKRQVLQSGDTITSSPYPMALRSTNGSNLTVLSVYSLIVVGDFEISGTDTLELASNGFMEIT